MPKLTEDIYAVPDGEIHPRLFKAGEDVTGNVAAAAEEQGKLAKPRKKASTTKAATPPENK